MGVYFTADPHFGHKNVIKYAKRPFRTSRGDPDVDAMDEAIAENWRAVVGEKDLICVIGDCAFYKNVDRTVALFASLPGRKVLAWGNHDKELRKQQRFIQLFERVGDIVEIKVADADARDGMQRIVLCHYPFRVWNKSHFGSWHLYGHSHGSLADDPCSLSLDVGVDCWNFSPVSYETVKAQMQGKRFVPIDHHGSDRED